MASVRTFTLPHYNAYPVHVALFKDVTNASYLRSQLLAANPDFDYAFLDATMVGSLAAAIVHGQTPLRQNDEARIAARHALPASTWRYLNVAQTNVLDAVPHLPHQAGLGLYPMSKHDLVLTSDAIISCQHLLSATFIALHNFLSSRSKTRTPHSELVFRLSPNNNIGESYKKFGIADTSTAIIAVKLPLSPSAQDGTYSMDETITNESVSKHLGGTVEGTSVEIGDKADELGTWCEVEKVRKVYKLGSADSGAGGKKGKKGAVTKGEGAGNKAKDEIRDMESVILGTIALKGS